ncbi:MAG: hypothetical protein Q9M25_10315 [Mariprofundaceae bacterium]|nr:hypothetical protein [Mariprofundaceae bacterium]
MNGMMYIKKSMAITISCALFLSGCAAGGASSSGFDVGPVMSSSYFKSKVKEKQGVQKPKLDIIVPVFDPGLPDDPEKYAKEGIWPELRRAESARFAYKMKLALEKTEAFGAVRVMPDKTATGDLYVLGIIEESNGENVEIGIKVYDISGKLWFSKSFTHDIAADFYSNIRNKGKDPYDPVFKKAAERLVEELDYNAAEDLARLQALTNLRFGANFSQAAFSQHMKRKGKIVSLVSYPDENDVMLRRVQAIRVRDQLFTDRMQPHYEEFSRKMDDSYTAWQKQSFTELAGERQAKRDAAGSAIAGVALIGLAVLSAVAGAQSDTYAGQTVGTTGAVVGGMVGARLLEKSFQTSKEAKFHREALAELGQSIDSEMAPQVVKFEKSTLKLTGSAKEQFAQWRAFLKKIYAQEATPDVQL